MAITPPADLRYRVDRYVTGDLSVTATCPADEETMEFWEEYADIDDYREDWATVTTTHPTLALSDGQIALAAYNHEPSLIARTMGDLHLTEAYTTTIVPYAAKVIVVDLPSEWRDNPLVDLGPALSAEQTVPSDGFMEGMGVAEQEGRAR